MRSWRQSVLSRSFGEAEFLNGRRATAHPSAFKALEEYCTIVDDRFVVDSSVIAARGVTAGNDLGLAIVDDSQAMLFGERSNNR